MLSFSGKERSEFPKSMHYCVGILMEEGIYAAARKADKFIVESELPIFKESSFECEMDTAKLLEVAKGEGSSHM